MPTKAKQPPRFLPTLTEVVQTSADASKASPGEASFAAPLKTAQQSSGEAEDSPSLVEMNVLVLIILAFVQRLAKYLR